MATLGTSEPDVSDWCRLSERTKNHYLLLRVLLMPGHQRKGREKAERKGKKANNTSSWLVDAPCVHRAVAKVHTDTETGRTRGKRTSSNSFAFSSYSSLTSRFISLFSFVTGLFSGFLFLVVSITSLIIFFVLIDHPTYHNLATVISELSHSTLLVFCSLATLIAFIKIRKLRFQPGKPLVIFFAFLSRSFSLSIAHLSREKPFPFRCPSSLLFLTPFIS